MSSQEFHESSGKGSFHWKSQRISAVALIPLTLWALFSIIHRIDDDYVTITNWIAQPYVAVLLVIYLCIMCFHGQLGIQEIIEDYIHKNSLKLICSWITKGVLLASAMVGLYSVMRIAL